MTQQEEDSLITYFFLFFKTPHNGNTQNRKGDEYNYDVNRHFAEQLYESTQGKNKSG